MGKLQELLSDPESMQQISELAQMFGGSGGVPPTNGNLGDDAPTFAPQSHWEADGGAGTALDPGMLMKMGELMRNSGGSDKNTALLMALRPHLGEQRQQRIDKALRLMKLWAVFQTMQKTGMLQQLL